MENKQRKQEVHSLPLISESTKPVPYAKRSVGAYGLTMIWFGMAVQLIIFMLAGQLYPSVSVGGILLALILGNTIPALVVFFTQEIGIRYGVNFAVGIRSMFGVKGSMLPAYLRAIPAMFWFGFQTWIGAQAINEVVRLLTGYSNEGLFIVVFGVAQIITTFYGVTFIKVMNVLASPLLLVMGIYLVYTLLRSSGVSLGEVLTMGGDGTGSLSVATMAFIGGWATLACSIQDIVKDCNVSEKDEGNWPKTNVKYATAQWLGMVPASCLFGFIGVLSMALGGEWNPVLAISKIVGSTSVPLAILFQIFILVATWTTNAGANLLNPAYVFCSTFTKKLDYTKAVIIAGAIGLLMFPWKLSDSLSVIMNYLGSALGPVAGIIISDYIFVRKRKVDLADLYRYDGAYRYWNGVNWGAIAVFVGSAAISLLFPSLMYFAGLVISLVLYPIVMKYWVNKRHDSLSCDCSRNDEMLKGDA